MMVVWPVLGPVLSDGLLSDCGRLAGCGGFVGGGCVPWKGVLWFCLFRWLVDDPRLGGRR